MTSCEMFPELSIPNWVYLLSSMVQRLMSTGAGADVTATNEALDMAHGLFGGTGDRRFGIQKWWLFTGKEVGWSSGNLTCSLEVFLIDLEGLLLAIG